MPSMEVSFNDLQKLVNKKLPKEESALWQPFSYLKAEADKLEGDNLKVELEDTNRPDLWGVEGFARSLKPILGTGKVKDYTAKHTNNTVIVGPGINKVRSFIATAILKKVKLTDEIIKQIMQFSERLDTGVGRRRAKTSIGIYNLHMIKFPVHYKLVSPKTKFKPLGFEDNQTIEDILKLHPKGIEYRHLLKGLKKYPVLMDAKGRILSMPPIINSNDVGRVTKETKELFIEVTGTHKDSVLYTLNNIALAFVDRGAELYSAIIKYPKGKEETPNLKKPKIEIKVSEVNKVTGLKLLSKECVPLLSKMGYGVMRAKDDVVTIIVPPYRSDIIGEWDVIEDIAIAYGFENIEPKSLRVPSVGGISNIEEKSGTSREIMIGLGFQEIMGFTLGSKETFAKKMNSKDEKLAEISNPMSTELNFLRNSLLPSMMDAFEKNSSYEYPQRMFEAGDVVVYDSKNPSGLRTQRKLCAVIAENNADFSRIKSYLESYFNALGMKYELKPAKDSSFINGRTAEIIVDKKKIGIIGELHPLVISNFNISVPVAAFEIEL